MQNSATHDWCIAGAIAGAKKLRLIRNFFNWDCHSACGSGMWLCLKQRVIRLRHKAILSKYLLEKKGDIDCFYYLEKYPSLSLKYWFKTCNLRNLKMLKSEKWI